MGAVRTDISNKTSYPKPTAGAANLGNVNINSHRITSIIALNATDIQGVTNLPEMARGILRTTVAGSYCVQEYFTDIKLYTRVYNGNAWSIWA